MFKSNLKRAKAMLVELNLSRNSCFVFFVGLGGLLCGICLGWSSPILYKLQDEDGEENPFGRKITNEEASWLNVSLAIGAIIGNSLSAILIDKIGRKLPIFLFSCAITGQFLILCVSGSLALHYLARVLGGVGTGAIACTCPIYLIETAESRTRGLFISALSAMLMLGVLFSFSLGPFITMLLFHGLCLFMSLLFSLSFLLLAPETPHFLLKQGRRDDALNALRFLRGKDPAALALEATELEEYLMGAPTGTFRALWDTAPTRRAFVISLTLQLTQQFSGIGVLLTYTQSIFEAADTGLSSSLCTVIIGAVQALSGVFGAVSLEAFGRRKVLLVTTVAQLLSTVLLAVYFRLKQGQNVSDLWFLPITAFIFYIIFYNFGIGIVPWVLMEELLPSNLRSKGSLIIMNLYFVVNFLFSKYYFLMVDSMGEAGPFWIFAALLAFAFIFEYVFVFETKGLTLGEVQEKLRNCKQLRMSEN